MSTWHQQRASVSPPADKWTIISDPPNATRTFWVCDTESEARKRLECWRMNGNGQHCFIVAPTAGARPIL
jgi:hypothetical protein